MERIVLAVVVALWISIPFAPFVIVAAVKAVEGK